jgi:hypothetical protein
MLFQDRTRDGVVWFFWPNLCEHKCTCLVGGLYTTSDHLNTVLKVCIFPFLNTVRNHTKITSCSILFVWFTVWSSLVIFRMSWIVPVDVLNSWSTWLWRHNSSPFPPVSGILPLDEIYFILFLFYYESRKRELKTKPICECRCDFIYYLLLWINKAKVKDKIYMWVSVLWKTTT